MAPNIKQNNGSLWNVSAGTGPASGLFQDKKSFDVIVIGGGICGSAAALTLADQGTHAALLEAGKPGCKATGRSAGFIVPAFSKISPAKVIDRYGAEGERLVDMVAGSADTVFSIIRNRSIECEAEQNGWFQPARPGRAFEQLQNMAGDWLSVGAKGCLHDAPETERLTGTRGYAGCWQATAGGTLHPVKFVNGLLSRAIEGGLAFFSETAAVSIDRHGSKWKVTTGKGALLADTVLICTNAQSPDLSADLFKSVVPLQVCQIATHPVPESERGHLLRQGQSMTDTQINLFSYRFDREGRLISGAIPVFPLADGRRFARRITRRLQRLLFLGYEPEAEFVWSGTASVTADFLPHIFELDAGIYAVTACNGRGLALSTAVGQAVGRALLTRAFDQLPIRFQRPGKIRGRSVKILGTRLYPIYGSIKDFLRI